MLEQPLEAAVAVEKGSLPSRAFDAAYEYAASAIHSKLDEEAMSAEPPLGSAHGRERGRSGRFVTLEGGEGAGKSTQMRLLQEKLAQRGVEAIATREPGGSPHAEALREALLGGKAAPLGPLGEAVLFSAARIDHLDRLDQAGAGARRLGSSAIGSPIRRAPIRARAAASIRG